MALHPMSMIATHAPFEVGDELGHTLLALILRLLMDLAELRGNMMLLEASGSRVQQHLFER